MNFYEALKRYEAIVQRLNDEYSAKMKFPKCIVSTEKGNRYFKVLCSGRIHTFLDKNGDILKAATWKSPAKNGVRGNIYSADGGESVINNYGAKYLK